MGRWKAIVGVAVLSLVVGAGIAWATIPDSNGVIHTCFKNNNWRVINAAARDLQPERDGVERQSGGGSRRDPD
jgi:hypothetical protein